MSARICEKVSFEGAPVHKATTYPFFEEHNFLISEGIGFGDDGYQVDLGMKTAHDLNVERLESMTRWLNEVDAGVDPVVNDIHAVDLVLGIKIRVEALLNVLDDRLPRVIVVDEIAKARGIDNCQTKAHAILLNIGADGLYGYRLGDDVQTRPLALTRWI